MPKPSSCKIIFPKKEDEVEIFTVPGFKYSPNKLDGMEIMQISSFDPVGRYLLGSKVFDK